MDYRERIKNTYKEMVLQRGFSRVTMDDLSARAGISKRTIYRYYKSKEEIIDTLINDYLTEFEQRILTIVDSSDSPVQKITSIIKVAPQIIGMIPPPVLYDLQKYYPHIWEKIELYRAARIQRIFHDFLSDNRQNHFKDINPAIFTTALLASIKTVVTPAFIISHNLSVEETVQTLFTIFLYGIVLEEKRHDSNY